MLSNSTHQAANSWEGARRNLPHFPPSKISRRTSGPIIYSPGALTGTLEAIRALCFQSVTVVSELSRDNRGSLPVGRLKTSSPRRSLPGRMSRNPDRHKRRQEWLPGQHPPRTRSQRVFGSWLFVDQGGYRPSEGLDAEGDCRLSQYVTMESV